MGGAADAFLAEAGRRTYVTPAAFLELLGLLGGLLGAQRARQAAALQRFARGLAKLEASAGQVAGMQAQLRARPQPAAASRGTPSKPSATTQRFRRAAELLCSQAC